MRKWPLFLASCCLCGGLFARSIAQTTERPTDIIRPMPPIWPPFPRPPFPRPFPAPLTDLKLTSQSVKVEIGGLVAKTHLRQTLQNPTERSLEGSYLFALPKGAAVANFSMTMGGKKLDSEILAGDKAREIYTGIVQKMRDPAILEFLDRDLVRAKIFPVPAGGSVDIELDYTQTVEGNRLTIPLRAPNGGQNSAKATVEVTLLDGDVRAVYSPSHAVETRHDGTKTLISGEFSDSDKDFSLLWTRGEGKVGLNLLTYKPEGEDGYFLLLAAPDPKLAPKEIEAKDVVFVFDTSGSMEGKKIEQARRALKSLLGNLNAKDRFNIVTFASGVNPFRDGLVDVTPANLNAARGFADGIKAVGGTNISEALGDALKMTHDGTRTQQIVFMTDGQPTVGQTSIDSILSDAKAENDTKTRLFVFGVGNDVNTRLLDSLAEDNRGASDYVLPDEDIEAKVGALYEKIAYPVLSDAKIDFGTLGAYDIFPPALPDLFRGSQATVFGRYRGAAPSKIALTGQSAGQTLHFNGTVSGDGTNEMPKLWATRKIGYLLDDARRNGHSLSDEVRDEVIKLSQKFGIVTPLTAALITEDDALGSFHPAPPPGAPVPMLRAGGGFGGGIAGRSALDATPQFNYRADSGAAGVAASKSNHQLREGRSDENANVQTVEGKTFMLRDGVWTDSAINEKLAAEKPRVVKFASEEYFGLLKDAKLAKWLSVGDHVKVVWEGKVLQIEP